MRLALFSPRPRPSLDIARGRVRLASASASLPRWGARPAFLRRPRLRVGGAGRAKGRQPRGVSRGVGVVVS